MALLSKKLLFLYDIKRVIRTLYGESFFFSHWDNGIPNKEAVSVLVKHTTTFEVWLIDDWFLEIWMFSSSDAFFKKTASLLDGGCSVTIKTQALREKFHLFSSLCQKLYSCYTTEIFIQWDLEKQFEKPGSNQKVYILWDFGFWRILRNTDSVYKFASASHDFAQFIP